MSAGQVSIFCGGGGSAAYTCCLLLLQIVYEICSITFEWIVSMESNHMHQSFNKSKVISTRLIGLIGLMKRIYWCLDMCSCVLDDSFSRCIVMQRSYSGDTLEKEEYLMMSWHVLTEESFNKAKAKTKTKALESITWYLGMYFSLLCPINLC